MSGNRARVLVVDYDEEILISLEHLLEDEGFDTTTAWTGLGALKALHDKAFDLILINEYLPDMDAEKLIQQMRGAARDVPCIVMQTSRAVIPDLRSFCWPGAAEVVCKWSPENVLEAVRTHQHHQRHVRT